MTKAHVKGHLKEAEGKIKEVAGKLVGNERLAWKRRARPKSWLANTRRPVPT